jgi:hypothetical protein
MPERRKLHRHKLFYFPEITDPKNHRLIGHLVDINLEGAMILGVESFTRGMNYTFGIEYLDEKAGDSLRTIQFTGRCQWVQNGVQSNTFAGGFRIETISPEHRDLLARMIEDFALPLNKAGGNSFKGNVSY